MTVGVGIGGRGGMRLLRGPGGQLPCCRDNALNLIVGLDVPNGTPLNYGYASEQYYAGSGGGYQVEIRSDVQEKWFYEPRVFTNFGWWKGIFGDGDGDKPGPPK